MLSHKSGGGIISHNVQCLHRRMLNASCKVCSFIPKIKIGIFHFSLIIEFGNLEFKFRIREPKLAKRCKEQIF